MVHTLFAVSAPGLEPLTAQELRDLGLLEKNPRRIRPGEGGLEFRGDMAALYRANLQLRTASRVLVRLGSFQATEFYELRNKASRLPWAEYLTPGQAVALRVTCHKSKLYHSDAVAERIAGAIGDSLGRSSKYVTAMEEADEAANVPMRPPPPLVVVRLVDDECTVSVDASGAGLHRRGYRQATAKAPLRETLAAGMLLASGWDRQAPLLDPFCGAGTIAIEAALLARQMAPGLGRRFAFMDWPGFDKKLWRTLLAEAEAQATVACPVIVGSDRDAGALEAARANAARAGVEANLTLVRRAISDLEAPAGPGWLITNPPYGVRLNEATDIRNLYARFGEVVRAHCPGWQLGVLLGDETLQKSLGLPFDEGRRRWLVNGGLKVKLARARVPIMARAQ